MTVCIRQTAAQLIDLSEFANRLVRFVFEAGMLAKQLSLRSVTPFIQQGAAPGVVILSL